MIQPERIQGRLETLARIVDAQQPPYTRRAFTDTYTEARRWLANEFRAAGLETSLDAGANLIGLRRGSSSGAGTIMMGSHIDTVVGGGRFDGAAGVVIGLEVAEALATQGIALNHDLEIVDFLSEEPSDYGVSCVGSRAMAGALNQAMLELCNAAGESLASAIERLGGSPRRLVAGPLRTRGELCAFLELHIEQGPVLESTSTDIGVVTGIVGIRRVEIVVKGRADHAGTTPMEKRSDALVVASELVVAVRELADRWSKRNGLVATIGKMTVSPNVPNVVPGEVSMVLEMRCTEPADLDAFMTELEGVAAKLVRQAALSIKPLSAAPPVPCSPEIRKKIWNAVHKLGLLATDIPSGAGHDAASMGLICPTAMVFVPSVGGRSHVPEEFTSIGDLSNGAAVMLETLLAVDAAL